MRTFKSLDNFKKYADRIAKKYEFTISKYNEDYSIDVNFVYIGFKDLTEFPIKFNIINGDFWCFNNNLKSLNGSPEIVRGDFYCEHNELTSLEGAPKYVGKNFDCKYNKLTSLEGAPEIIRGGWSIEDNFKFAPIYRKYKLVKKIQRL